jgi:Protein of unknown function (DUF3551)
MEVHMHGNLAIGAAAVLVLLVTAESSSAEVIYPWCAQYGTRGGARNCGFTTLEQCRAAISGNGGYCIENPFYQWRPDPARRDRPRRGLGAAEIPSAEPLTSGKPMARAVSLVARSDRHAAWCELKGRRGDPKLFLSQQASDCFD